MMTPLLAQRLIAAPFLVLGALCVFFPETVERLGVRAEYYHGSPATALFIGCFGAQAILSGLFAALSGLRRVGSQAGRRIGRLVRRRVCRMGSPGGQHPLEHVVH